jgi:hypothetical protein
LDELEKILQKKANSNNVTTHMFLNFLESKNISIDDYNLDHVDLFIEIFLLNNSIDIINNYKINLLENNKNKKYFLFANIYNFFNSYTK